MGTKFISENCAKAAVEDYDMINPPQAADFFKMFNELDQGYKDAVNGNMCNDICMCPGQKGDAWYDEYKAIPAEELAKYKRTWDATDLNNKLLHFQPLDPNAVDRTIDTVQKCITSTDEILDKIGEMAVQQAIINA